MMSKLTAKQAQFVLEYLVDLNATKAAIRAGYSQNYAGTNADKLLKNTKVQSAIELALIERSERTQINADLVLKHNTEILFADIADIIDSNNHYLPIKQWPKIWRQMLSGVDIQELFDGHGSDRKKIGEVLKIKFIDRLKALEMVGKHTDVQAYKDKVDLNIGGQPDNPLTILAKAVQGSALPVKK